MKEKVNIFSKWAKRKFEGFLKGREAEHIYRRERELASAQRNRQESYLEAAYNIPSSRATHKAEKVRKVKGILNAIGGWARNVQADIGTMPAQPRKKRRKKR